MIGGQQWRVESGHNLVWFNLKQLFSEEIIKANKIPITMQTDQIGILVSLLTADLEILIIMHLAPSAKGRV